MLMSENRTHGMLWEKNIGAYDGFKNITYIRTKLYYLYPKNTVYCFQGR